ncbi:hypothetical protein ACFLWI_07875 [Chloroflexota bacterium]
MERWKPHLLEQLASFHTGFCKVCRESMPTTQLSEIDHFVPHTPTGKAPGTTDILGRKTSGPGEGAKKIAEYTATLIRDGDTIEVGVGGAA